MADLFHRVSIRKFKDEAVSNEDIGYILEAAMAAPSATAFFPCLHKPMASRRWLPSRWNASFRKPSSPVPYPKAPTITATVFLPCLSAAISTPMTAIRDTAATIPA